MTPPPHVLLIIGGGIAAYKTLDLIRLLRRDGIAVSSVLTAGGARFVTPLSVQALSGGPVRTDLWSLTDEHEMGHIQLSRAADVLLVAPASADLLARMAAGLADDLAGAVLLATDKPVLVAPAMNVRMWEHPATVANMNLLRARYVQVVGPDVGEMACGEWGAGRMAAPDAIANALHAMLPRHGALAGRRALVTSGPTREAIDPVRAIINHSSGRQGHAIAAALAALGADVTLISGPVALSDPPGTRVVRVETAAQMLAACQAALPADIAVCAAAVADWQVAAPASQKLKKGTGPPQIELVSAPDILATLSAPGPHRPGLVIGFAAETEQVQTQAEAKRLRKGCDWIVANDVSVGTGAMGGETNQVIVITDAGAACWPRLPKTEIARRLAQRVAEALAP